MADLEELRALCAFMRENGILSASSGDVSLTLDPHFAPASESSESTSPDADDDVAVRNLETLLYSSGGDSQAIAERLLRPR